MTLYVGFENCTFTVESPAVPRVGESIYYSIGGDPLPQTFDVIHVAWVQAVDGSAALEAHVDVVRRPSRHSPKST
jgi:hypothetical protein